MTPVVALPSIAPDSGEARPLPELSGGLDASYSFLLTYRYRLLPSASLHRRPLSALSPACRRRYLYFRSGRKPDVAGGSRGSQSFSLQGALILFLSFAKTQLTAVRAPPSLTIRTSLLVC